MSSCKSEQNEGGLLNQQRTTAITSINEDTNRRVFLDPETGLRAQRSRSNKTCTRCGEQKSGRGLFCLECYQEVRKAEVSLTCAFCHTDFLKKKYEYDKALRVNPNQKDFYCSATCSRSHHAVKNSKPCPICGGRKKKDNKYCSRACQKSDHGKKLKPIACQQCQKEFQPVSSRTMYCAKECADKAHSIRMVGKQNSRYKTGTSYAKLFRSMRPLILERDNHCCSVCNAPDQPLTYVRAGVETKRSNLVIHHIDEDTTHNHPKNLITMCKTCHAIHHKSEKTPFPQLAKIAEMRNQSMTSKWTEHTTSLLTKYLSTTV